MPYKRDSTLQITTVNNINRYREQLDKIGFSFDWNREIRTCDPEYYHWTQWAFQKMFNSYYCNDQKQARPIQELIDAFPIYGNEGLNAACSEELHFTAEEWNAKSEKEQQEILMNYRIAYLGETMVNWCPQLGTVLANDEVVDGVSERGGFPRCPEEDAPMVPSCICLCTTLAGRTRYHRLDRFPEGNTEKLDRT